jgi:hypothetical protein
MNETLLGNVDNATPPLDQNKDYLTELVGEGKKFKTPQDLARSKYEADSFIEVLKRQQDELRADYLKLREDNTAKAKLEELIGQLEAKQQQLASNNQPIVTEVKDKPPTFDPKQIESLVSSEILKLRASEKEENNFNQVKVKLTERFGNNYQSALKQQIDELGLSESDINALARKSPTAFYKTLGLDTPVQQETFQAPPRSNQRSDNFKPKGGEKRTWSFYQEMKRNDPKRYLDPKTNVQIHNDMMALGDEFKDGDYHAYGD